MKKFILYAFLPVAMALHTGCQDPCRGVVCLNEAQCDDGKCKCPYGPEDGYTEDCRKIAGDVFATVNTNGFTNLTQTSVVVQGKVANIGGSPVTARGICWSKTLIAPSVEAGEKTVNGEGIGDFYANIDNLFPATKYYYRAYATNAAGTAYGDVQTFTTAGGAGPSVTDIDGNTYSTVYIGGKLWMAENLRVTKYRNGDAITANISEYGWANTHAGAWAIYDNSATNHGRFGKLYNWYAVNDWKGLAPEGWHIPSQDEWQSLMVAAGGAQAGGKLKDTWTTYWNSPNTGATNELGFNARGGGYRTPYDTEFYMDKGLRGYWWTSTSQSGDYALFFGLGYNSVEYLMYGEEKNSGFSVRCVKD